MAYYLLHEELPGQKRAASLYGPERQVSSMTYDVYHFEGVKQTFGALPLRALERSGEINASLFKQLVLSSMPQHLGQRLDAFLDLSLHYSQRFQIDPFWVLAVMWAESHFQPKAKSYVHAKGLMQIMPMTGHFLFRRLGRPLSPDIAQSLLYDPSLNIELGTFYLKQLLNKFKGNHRLATVAYNMGPGFVYMRLKQNRPVGQKNLYLDKVERAYNHLIKAYKSYMLALPPAYQFTLVVDEALSQVTANFRQQAQFVDNFLIADIVQPPFRRFPDFHIASSEVFY